MRCSAEGTGKKAAAVTSIMMLPGAAASQCMPAVSGAVVVEQSLWPSTGMQVAIGIASCAISLALACCVGCYLEKKIQQFRIAGAGLEPHPEPPPRRTRAWSSNRASQTEAIKVRRYWDEPKDSVLSLALKRGIPGAAHPRATRTEMASLLLQQDLGSLASPESETMYRERVFQEVR